MMLSNLRSVVSHFVGIESSESFCLYNCTYMLAGSSGGEERPSGAFSSFRSNFSDCSIPTSLGLPEPRRCERRAHGSSRLCVWRKRNKLKSKKKWIRLIEETNDFFLDGEHMALCMLEIEIDGWALPNRESRAAWVQHRWSKACVDASYLKTEICSETSSKVLMSLLAIRSYCTL